MKGRFKEYQREQQYFIMLNSEEIRKQNPIVSAIDDYIENYIELELFETNTCNIEVGQKAENPKMMLKLLFYCYSQECYTSREIESRSKYDQNAIYLCGNRSVDHSTICRFISKSENQINEIFTMMVYVLGQMGYVNKDLVAIDGTKIRANVSEEFTCTKQQFESKKKHIETKIQKILEETQYPSERIQRKLNKFEKNKDKIKQFIKDSKINTENEDKKINITDPDARMMKDNGKYYTGYNCQTAAESSNHFIVGCTVNNIACDRHQLIPMIEQVKEGTAENKKQKVVADAGYFSTSNIKYADENGIDLYLPEGRGEGGIKRMADDKITSRDCIIYEKGKKKCLTCPGGYTSVVEEARCENGRLFYRFSVPSSACENCQNIKKCIKTFKRGRSKNFMVMKDYFDYSLLRNQMTEKLKSAHGKAIYNERSCIIEHIFAEIKEHKKFRKFYHRGLDNVNIIWRIVCIAYNFRKLAKLHYA